MLVAWCLDRVEARGDPGGVEAEGEAYGGDRRLLREEGRSAGVAVLAPVAMVPRTSARAGTGSRTGAGGPTRVIPQYEPGTRGVADPLEAAFLKQPQQLDMEGQGQIADFVEEQGPLRSHLAAARLVAHRPGPTPWDAHTCLSPKHLSEGEPLAQPPGSLPPECR